MNLYITIRRAIELTDAFEEAAAPVAATGDITAAAAEAGTRSSSSTGTRKGSGPRKSSSSNRKGGLKSREQRQADMAAAADRDADTR